jgi:hypothetical protein
MSADRRETATPVGLGLRALKGGAVVVGVAVESGEPRVVLSTFLATCAMAIASPSNPTASPPS